jgi:hypothetical protein
MASNGLTVNALELELCEQTMIQQAAAFGGITENFTQGPGPRIGTGTAFGTLPASAQLAGLTAQVNDAGNDQFSAADNFLRGIESALDQALQGYLSADGVSAAEAAEVGALVSHLDHMGLNG